MKAEVTKRADVVTEPVKLGLLSGSEQIGARRAVLADSGGVENAARALAWIVR